MNYFCHPKNKRLAHAKRKFLSILLLALGLDFFGSLYFASNAQIIPDNNFENKSNFNSNTNIIDGGIRSGVNLFHSFQDFNVLEGQSVYFRNPLEVQNIISRVTGGDPSNIRGKIGVLGNANLFILNPSGIFFYSNASLDIKGSFLATTANAIQFGNQGFFDLTPSNSPSLLTVNPTGFLFTKSRSAPIVNSSSLQLNETRKSNDSVFRPSVPLSGLKVKDGHSLILLGGEVTIDGGGLYALGGQIGIGSVASNGLVSLSFDGDKLKLSFPNNVERGNIFFLNGARVDTSSTSEFGGGNIQIIGKNIQIKDASRIVSETTGLQDGGTLTLDAKDSLEIIGFITGNNVSTLTSSSGKGGTIKIIAGKFLVKDEAQIFSGTLDKGSGGDIDIYVSDFIELDGNNSAISSTTFSSGTGGNIKIETPGNLFLSNGALLSAGGGSSGVNGRNVSATGDGGNLDILVGNSIKIDNSLLSSSNPRGKAGNISINTRFLTLQDGGIISVRSTRNKAGDLTVIANSLTLDGGFLSANTGVSGANIFLTVFDRLLLKNESRITATASGSADGGNIRIDVPILLALPPTGSEGSDIIANAISGSGGKITINSQGVFGIEQREAKEGNQTNDISASSQFGQSGQVQINATTDPNQGLVELPATVVDPSTLVAQNPCKRASSSEFTRSGRGGLPPSLSQDLNGESTQVGLVEPVNVSAEKLEPKSDPKQASSIAQSSSQIAPAQGWVYNNKGEVVLVAYNSAITGSQRIQTAPAGCPVF
jgi:filamentous hemagglutinin family protein